MTNSDDHDINSRCGDTSNEDSFIKETDDYFKELITNHASSVNKTDEIKKKIRTTLQNIIKWIAIQIPMLHKIISIS